MSEKTQKFKEHAQTIFAEVRPEVRDLTAAALSRSVKRGITALMMASMRKRQSSQEAEDTDNV